MNRRTFSPNPRASGKTQHHHHCKWEEKKERKKKSVLQSLYLLELLDILAWVYKEG